jgi:hypothetical protein
VVNVTREVVLEGIIRHTVDASFVHLRFLPDLLRSFSSVALP